MITCFTPRRSSFSLAISTLNKIHRSSTADSLAPDLMIRFFLVTVTGWLAVLGTGIGASLPYLLRIPNPRSAPTQNVATLFEPLPSFRTRLWPHYWIGYTLLVLVLMHASFVMGPAMARSDPTGIWAATLALFLLFFQLGIGLVLKEGSEHQRQFKRFHFWIMIVFCALVGTHLLTNWL